ncbi:glycoside hydrolase family 20 protein [Pedobacter frigoris]|uniref:glycoside hydrolase family 20 protein n=1 Tax=Pedobacter frigoris TaxID=2571272 RepID=UPI001CEC0621|nr:family 20 glycosylhydrolase [Pedobacter frigoris]
MTGGNYTGMSSNYCAGNEEVFSFLTNVLDEVLECQARIKDEHLKDENELQSYFITRMGKYLIGKKRKMIGWDEILEGGLAPEATVMSWRGEAGGIEAAKMKHDVIMTPGNPVYFDTYQAGPAGEPVAIGGFNTLKKVYDYEPIPKELNKDDEKYVLGAQANVWTEFITTTEHLEYMVLPRMLALAEVVWSPKENKDFVDFSKRLPYHFRGFEQKGFHYSPGNYTVVIKPFSQNGKLLVDLSSEMLNAGIYYTLDGSEPTLESNKYSSPFPINSSALLKASIVLNGKVMGYKPAEQSFVMHKAVGKDVKYANPVNRYYLADGPNSLTDGVKGTSAVGKYWHGFNGTDLVATIDLGTDQRIKTVSLGCLQNYNDWIFLPQQVKFEMSIDGVNYTELAIVNNTIPVDQKFSIKDFKAEFPERKARFVRVTAKNLGVCPPGHSGAGKPAWLFADEIVVN